MVYRVLPSDIRKQINRATKAEAQPIWKTETAQMAVTKIQIRTLSETAKVGVTNRNVFLRAGGGKYANLLTAAEFGRPASAPVKSKSRLKKPYTRATGGLFGDRDRRGKVVFPAARGSMSRFASLWIQTALRTLHETGEKV